MSTAATTARTIMETVAASSSALVSVTPEGPGRLAVQIIGALASVGAALADDTDAGPVVIERILAIGAEYQRRRDALAREFDALVEPEPR